MTISCTQLSSINIYIYIYLFCEIVSISHSWPITNFREASLPFQGRGDFHEKEKGCRDIWLRCRLRSSPFLCQLPRKQQREIPSSKNTNFPSPMQFHILSQSIFNTEHRLRIRAKEIRLLIRVGQHRHIVLVRAMMTMYIHHMYVLSLCTNDTPIDHSNEELHKAVTHAIKRLYCHGTLRDQ